ncbi:unnamed protein product [Closterium sp. Naga37s-1]|nr:unnamed protein product [Closterium sp. Naga37s-1]
MACSISARVAARQPLAAVSKPVAAEASSSARSAFLGSDAAVLRCLRNAAARSKKGSHSAGARRMRLPPARAALADVRPATKPSEEIAVAHEAGEEVTASAEFRAQALVKDYAQYEEMYRRSIEEPDAFWADLARQFYWRTPFPVSPDGKVHSENLDVRRGRVNVEWFKGGATNICYNAVDRWVEQGQGHRVAFFWEGNNETDSVTLTYAELLERVKQTAAYLRSQGVKRGDYVTIYMPMVLELPVAMLACARIGAVHSVVFGGFSAESLAQRMQDCESRVLLTCSGTMRGSKPILLKDIADAAIALSPDLHVARVVVADNPPAMARDAVNMVEGRDVWWQDVIGHADVAPGSDDVEWMDAEDPLFLLYTSGSTGRPKGVVHTTGGYMVYTATTFKHAFDWKPSDVYWCTADCGWITGHSYVAYGPLLNGASQVLFEGVPNYPDWGRWWRIVDRYAVSLFYTAPTAIRAAMRSGDQWVEASKRTSLRVLGSVGEPINPSAWKWYSSVVGEDRCPISDTWWQTETGGFMILPLPGAWPQRPGAASFPFFGVQAAMVDERGEEVQGEGEGYLCVRASWPGMFRTLLHDHDRYETNYFAPFKGFYFSGDGCRRDADGYYWVTGRVDDVINVSGHRIGTAEVESALVAHPACAEAAVVGFDHEIKGQGIYAYVTLVSGVEYADDLRLDLVRSVRSTIGAFAAPDHIHWAPHLPKTRSGKIMRRVLRKIAARQEDELGDLSTLADPSVVPLLLELRDSDDCSTCVFVPPVSQEEEKEKEEAAAKVDLEVVHEHLLEDDEWHERIGDAGRDGNGNGGLMGQNGAAKQESGAL